MYSDYSVAIYVLPFSHLDAFGLGAFISRFEIPKARWQFFALLLLLPVIGFVTTYYFTGSWGDLTALGFSWPLAKGMKQIWGYTYLDYVCALFIYIVVKTNHSSVTSAKSPTDSTSITSPSSGSWRASAT